MAVGLAVADGPAGAWTTVYLMERSLSLDNVFLFSLLLGHFLVPPGLRGRVVLFGIVGALVLRGVAIVAGLTLIEHVEAVVYVFGALLLYVAYRAFRGTDEEQDAGSQPRAARGAAGRADQRRTSTAGTCSCARRAGSTATPLLLAIVAIVVADIAFAVDSIPAALVVTRDPVVIWTANAFALLGLGALLALVDILVRRFPLPADATIAVILAFVGLKIVAGRRRAHRRPRLARDHRRPARRRCGGLADRRPPRPAGTARGGLPAPAALPEGTEDSGTFRAAADLERGRASDEDVINSQPPPSPRRRSGSLPYSELIERLPELGGVAVDAECACARQLVLAVATAQQADAEHPGSPGGQQIPDGVADDVGVRGGHTKSLGARQEEIRLRLGALDVAALDDDRFLPDAERFQ